MRNVADTLYRKSKHTFYVQQPLFFCPKIDNVQKYGTAGQVKDDNMAHKYCMLDT
jgi:hypothetical protein